MLWLLAPQINKRTVYSFAHYHEGNNKRTKYPYLAERTGSARVPLVCDW
jgi:hypothetical protein